MSSAPSAVTLRRCLVLAALACPQALAQPPAILLDASTTDPATQAVLQRGETFYVRVAYRTDRPVRIRIHGLRRGQIAPMMTNPSPRSDPPSGETVVWLASDREMSIDEVRIYADDETNGKAIVHTSLPVSLEWTGVTPSTSRQEAEWARSMSQAQQQTISRDMRNYSQSSGGFFGMLIGLVIGLSLPGYIAAQIWSLRRLEGGWRNAAYIPLFVMGGALIFSLFALSRGSNLWPIWLILLAPAALIWLVVLMLLNRTRAHA